MGYEYFDERVESSSDFIDLLNLPDDHKKTIKGILINFQFNISQFDELVNNFPNLELLYIASSLLKNIPDSIEDFKNLEDLRITDFKNLECLPKNIDKLIKLKKLSISNIPNLTKLGKIGNMHSLESLRLSSLPSLKGFPDNIIDLLCLKELSLLSLDSLIQLPKKIGDLINLEKLEIISCNSLTQIPGSIGNLKKIKSINFLCLESVTQLPESIGNLSCLKDLTIDSLGITKLPNTYSKLQCHISVYPHSVFVPKQKNSRNNVNTDNPSIYGLIDEVTGRVIPYMNDEGFHEEPDAGWYD